MEQIGIQVQGPGCTFTSEELGKSYELYLCSPIVAAAAWPKVEPLVRKAIDKGPPVPFTAKHVEDWTAKGLAHIWLISKGNEARALVVTQDRPYPTARVLDIIACAGIGLREWLPFINTIANVAEKNGYHFLRTGGRKGWKRVLGRFGFEAMPNGDLVRRLR